MFIPLQKKREQEDVAKAVKAAGGDDADSYDSDRDAVEPEIAVPSAPIVRELVGDDFTRRSFGSGAVVVTTRFGLGDEDGGSADGPGDRDEAALQALASRAPKRVHTDSVARDARPSKGGRGKPRGGRGRGGGAAHRGAAAGRGRGGSRTGRGGGRAPQH